MGDNEVKLITISDLSGARQKWAKKCDSDNSDALEGVEINIYKAGLDKIKEQEGSRLKKSQRRELRGFRNDDKVFEKMQALETAKYNAEQASVPKGVYIDCVTAEQVNDNVTAYNKAIVDAKKLDITDDKIKKCKSTAEIENLIKLQEAMNKAINEGVPSANLDGCKTVAEVNQATGEYHKNYESLKKNASYYNIKYSERTTSAELEQQVKGAKDYEEAMKTKIERALADRATATYEEICVKDGKKLCTEAFFNKVKNADNLSYSEKTVYENFMKTKIENALKNDSGATYEEICVKDGKKLCTEAFFNQVKSEIKSGVKIKTIETEKSPATPEEIAANAKKLGYKETYASKSRNIYYDAATSTHYEWDDTEQEFVSLPGVKQVNGDGSMYMNDGSIETYTYDESGKLLSKKKKKSNHSTETYTYAESGKVRSFEENNTSYHLVKEYNEDGMCTKQVIKNSESIKTSTYDESGKLVNIETSDVNGNLKSTETFIYGKSGKLEYRLIKDANGSKSSGVSYTYDNNGDIDSYAYFTYKGGKCAKRVNQNADGQKTAIWEFEDGKNNTYISYECDINTGIKTGKCYYYDNDIEITKEEYEKRQK